MEKNKRKGKRVTTVKKYDKFGVTIELRKAGKVRYYLDGKKNEVTVMAATHFGFAEILSTV